MMEISSLMSAVKPRERTDQYLILSAMLCLDAHTTPVTAKQISDLLKLHLGAKSPANVNASLRAYKAYVPSTKMVFGRKRHGIPSNRERPITGYGCCQ
jgi:hypothetical protein